MRNFDNLGKKKAVLGMLHLGAMPGTPFYEDNSYEATFERAMQDARALYEGGATGCLVQTVDRAYPAEDEADYARVVGVAHVVRAIAQMTGPEFQIGVQIMWNALKPSLAVAKVSGGSFLRCTALIGATMSPAGLVQANPHDFRKRYRVGTAKMTNIVPNIFAVMNRAMSPPSKLINSVPSGFCSVSCKISCVLNDQYTSNVATEVITARLNPRMQL